MSERPVNKSHLNRLKDGRGQGRGEHYVPFIQANDNKVASEGWLTRTLGWRSNRIHHTLSKHEYDYFLVQEWADRILDIREQYPLSEIDLTRKIAQKLNITHPYYEGKDVVMSTDFMLTFRDHNGDLHEIARTIKPISKLNKRTIELFEIERRYYLEMGQSWRVVFGDNKPINLIRNIDWLYDAKRLENRPGMDSSVIKMVDEPLLKYLMENGNKRAVSKVCLESDKKLGLEEGSSMFITRYMLVNKEWETDMNQLIRLSQPLKVTRRKK